MKLFLVVLSVAALAAAELVSEPVEIQRYYHENVGIYEAARIKAAEQASDFDGSRIVGGSAASLGQYPFIGGLVITLTSGATSVCGSTLLSNTRSVTAAHCWWDGRNQARQFTVVLGSTLLFSGGTRVNTNNVVMHGSWNPNNLNNDIAMITLSWVNFSNIIGPATRATGSNNFAGNWANAAGFGRTSDSTGISTSQFLSHVSLQVITNAVCQSVYGSSSVVASTICTSGANGQGTCGGDSGGPLVIGSNLIGVVSFGAAAGCQRGFPAAYARVTAFESWINSRM